jgi:hypothetical protein
MELTNWPTRDRQEVVIALQALPAEVNSGYHDIYKSKLENLFAICISLSFLYLHAEIGCFKLIPHGLEVSTPF